MIGFLKDDDLPSVNEEFEVLNPNSNPRTDWFGVRVKRPNSNKLSVGPNDIAYTKTPRRKDTRCP